MYSKLPLPTRFPARKLLGAALIACAGHANATGMMSCDSGEPASWRTQEELHAVLEQEGWQVSRSKVDEGCYEVYGTTPEGDRVEAYFDPVSFEKLLVSRRGEILYRKE